MSGTFSRVVICLLAWLLCASSFVLAQDTTATVLGTVKDSTGAVLPGTAVDVHNVQTGIAREAVTDGEGRYRVTSLGVGLYEVTATLSGFQTVVRSGIELTVGREAVVNFDLKIGEMNDNITVVGEAPLVETTRAVMAGLVTEKQVQQLPLNSRSLIELLPLQAGISFTDYGNSGSSTGFAKKVSIGGTRYNSNLFVLDGVNINDRAGSAGSAAGVLMGVETVKEFNVIKNAYSAEYGRHTGGVLSAVTKSGTNEMHGSVFEYLRDNNLDSSNFFDVGDPPPYRRHQMGFSFGGPITKDRRFIFGSYEGLRERLQTTSRFIVPNQDAHNGLLPTAGVLKLVGVAANVKPFLDSYPLPNGQDFGDGTGELVTTLKTPTNEDSLTVRFDQQLPRAASLFARYSGDVAKQTSEGMLSVSTSNTKSNYGAVGLTNIMGSRMVNRFLFGFAQSASSGGTDPRRDLPLLSFTDGGERDGLGTLGSITITGLASWGGGDNRKDEVKSFQFSNVLSYTRGSHSFKFGGEVEKRNTYKFTGNFQRAGVYAFRSLADFLASKVNTFNGGTVEGDNQYREWIYGAYVQDDIRVRSNLTLNAGLRYEPQGPFKTVKPSPNFRLDVRQALGLTVNDISVSNPVYVNPSLKNFAPRIGVAWDPRGDQKTSVRAGFGTFFYQITAGKDFGSAIDLMPPNTIRGQMTAAQLTVPIDFPNAFFTQSALLKGVVGADPFQWEPNQPKVLKWSLTLQREIASRTTIEVDYSGNKGIDLLMQAEMNVPIAQVVDGRLFIPSTAPLRDPTLGRVRVVEAFADSIYHGLGLQLNRRFSGGLQFQASYTLSKAKDDASSTGADFSNDRNEPRYMDTLDRGLSPFDVRHNVSLNTSWVLPTGSSSMSKILGGWQVSAIGRFASGAPTSLASGASPAWFSNVQDFPDMKQGAEISIDSRNTDRYFDPAAFVLQAPGFIGNAPRNNLTLPGVATMDLALRKDFSLWGRSRIGVRAEAYNLLNRANFGRPNTTLFNTDGSVRATAGRITTTNTTARQIQLGVRLDF